MHKFCFRTRSLLLWFQFLPLFVFSQLLSGKSHFSKYDTLMGTVSSIRDYNALHYDLDIQVDLDKKFISGKCRMQFRPQHRMDTIQIDLFSRYQIQSIRMNGQELAYQRDSNFIYIFPKKPLESKTTYTIQTTYSGYPIAAKRAPWDGGFVWSQDANNHHWVGVACEGLGASSWWPCKDHWSDEPDYGVSIHVTVPNPYITVSNGKLISKNNLGTHTRWDWLVTNPINLYNVTLNIAQYENLKSEFTSLENGKSLDINYWVLPEHRTKAEKQFEQVIPMLLCHEARFGAYPFYEDGYQMVETPYLGMEHQSCIAYGNEYKNGYRGNLGMTGGHEFDYIIIHESGHEWYGNNITAADNADMWIHEAFTTYAESIYAECMYGADAGPKYIESLKSRIQNKEPIQGYYGVAKEGSGDMYAKGAVFLHTLRLQIDNDSIWYDILKSMHSEFHHKVTDYETILQFFNTKSKMDLSPLFDVYLRYGSIPELTVTKSISPSKITLTLTSPNQTAPLRLKVKYKIDGMEKSSYLDNQTALEIPYNYEFKLIEDNYLKYRYK